MFLQGQAQIIRSLTPTTFQSFYFIPVFNQSGKEKSPIVTGHCHPEKSPVMLGSEEILLKPVTRS